jgi:hypothetical protein
MIFLILFAMIINCDTFLVRQCTLEHRCAYTMTRTSVDAGSTKVSLLKVVSRLYGHFQDDNIDNDRVTKGFGNTGNEGFRTKRRNQENVKATRPTVFREVRGQYARLLADKALTFEKMRNQGIVTTFDLYVRASNSDLFWFVGKLNHDDTKLSATAALVQELQLIKEYAKSLRPNELSGPHAVNFRLEVFTTEGNNEMNVAQNKINLVKFDESNAAFIDSTVIPSSQNVLRDDDSVGFEPEIYQGGEDGFRVRRKDDGTPLKAAFEINQKTPQELEEIKRKEK